jgi:hypothetical protein
MRAKIIPPHPNTLFNLKHAALKMATGTKYPRARG